MRLESLHVLHRSKRKGEFSLPSSDGAFFVDTCQRSLWVAQGDAAGRLEAASDWLVGEEAYLELLLIACGLESEILGETDVFGQLKDAWRGFEASSKLAARGLLPIVQGLFEDTKEIRARYLQKLGGASYGTLARRLLSPSPGDRVLVVGAGRIARSVAPYFNETEVWIVNRTSAGAKELARELAASGAKHVHVVTSAPEKADAWRVADHALICVPSTPELDGEHAAQWRDGAEQGSRRGRFLHLGCLSRTVALPSDGFTLEDLFRLRTSQDSVRQVAVRAAVTACRERARLRALGGSLWLAHGWEDLAAFQ